MIAQWLENDPWHRSSGVTIDDAYAPGSELAILEDDAGPIMAVRLNLSLHVGIQFGPTPYRNAKAGAALREWLKEIALKRGATEVFGLPGGRAVKFFEKLGWRDFKGKILKCL